MTKKSMKEFASKLESTAVLIKTSGNATWTHKFYKYEGNGRLYQVSYKDGKLDEIVCLGI